MLLDERMLVAAEVMVIEQGVSETDCARGESSPVDNRWRRPTFALSVSELESSSIAGLSPRLVAGRAHPHYN
jgi:hypothetical protein